MILGVYTRDPNHSVVLLGSRVDGLALGSILAMLDEDLLTYGSWRWNVFGFALASFGLIGLLRSGRLRVIREGLSHPLMTWIGDRSYSIYMLHGLAFLIVLTLGRRFPVFENIVHTICVASAILIGHFSYLFIEQKIGPLKRHFPMVER